MNHQHEESYLDNRAPPSPVKNFLVPCNLCSVTDRLFRSWLSIFCRTSSFLQRSQIFSESSYKVETNIIITELQSDTYIYTLTSRYCSSWATMVPCLFFSSSLANMEHSWLCLDSLCSHGKRVMPYWTSSDFSCTSENMNENPGGEMISKSFPLLSTTLTPHNIA